MVECILIYTVYILVENILSAVWWYYEGKCPWNNCFSLGTGSYRGSIEGKTGFWLRLFKMSLLLLVGRPAESALGMIMIYNDLV